jgi:hypothetical protein
MSCSFPGRNDAQTAPASATIRAMRTQRITNRSEALAERIIRTTLAGAGWSVAIKLPLQVVLDREQEALPYEEFQLLTRGHLDFTIYDAVDHRPAFAIEFDGLGHDDPRQIKRDVTKNRLCARAGLPLIRIGFAELHEQEQMTVLGWLIERFVTWERDVANAHHAPSPRTPEGELLPARYLYTDLQTGAVWVFRSPFECLRVEIGPGGILQTQVEDDPDVLLKIAAGIFSDRNPYPGNAVIAERLLTKFGIECPGATEPREAKDRASAPYVFEIAWPGKRHPVAQGRAGRAIVAEREALLRKANRPNQVPFRTVGLARLTLANKTGLTPAEEEALEPDPPWINPEWMAIDLAAYDALRELERWAKLHLSGRKAR